MGFFSDTVDRMSRAYSSSGSVLAEAGRDFQNGNILGGIFTGGMSFLTYATNTLSLGYLNDAGEALRDSTHYEIKTDENGNQEAVITEGSGNFITDIAGRIAVNMGEDMVLQDKLAESGNTAAANILGGIDCAFIVADAVGGAGTVHAIGSLAVKPFAKLAAKAAAKTTAKTMAEVTAKQTGKVVAKEATGEIIEQGAKAVAKDAVGEVVEQGAKTAMKEAVGEVAEQGAKVAAKEAVGEIAEQGAKVAAKEAVGEIAEQGAKTATKTAAKGTFAGAMRKTFFSMVDTANSKSVGQLAKSAGLRTLLMMNAAQVTGKEVYDIKTDTDKYGLVAALTNEAIQQAGNIVSDGGGVFMLIARQFPGVARLINTARAAGTATLKTFDNTNVGSYTSAVLSVTGDKIKSWAFQTESAYKDKTIGDIAKEHKAEAERNTKGKSWTDLYVERVTRIDKAIGLDPSQRHILVNPETKTTDASIEYG